MQYILGVYIERRKTIVNRPMCRYSVPLKGVIPRNWDVPWGSERCSPKFKDSDPKNEILDS